MAMVGGLVAMALFVILGFATFKNVTMWSVFLKGGLRGGGAMGVITGFAAGLLALVAVAVAVLSFRSLRTLVLETYLGAALGLVLVSMLGYIGDSCLPFWIAASIMLIIGGARIASAETMRIRWTRQTDDDVTYFTAADFVMLGAAGVMFACMLIGIIAALFGMSKGYYWRHLANMVILFFLGLANMGVGLLAVSNREMLKVVRWLSLVIAGLAAVSHFGLYAMNGLVVIFGVVAACVAYYIEKEGEAFGIDQLSADEKEEEDASEETDAPESAPEEEGADEA